MTARNNLMSIFNQMEENGILFVEVEAEFQKVRSEIAHWEKKILEAQSRKDLVSSSVFKNETFFITGYDPILKCVFLQNSEGKYKYSHTRISIEQFVLGNLQIFPSSEASSQGSEITG